MPASKRDLDTIHGRLQFARSQAGFTRAEFAGKVEREKDVYYSADGWAKIELGTNSLSADILLKANQILNLDERFYFGKISYEEAMGGASSSTSIEEMAKDIREVKRRIEGVPGDEVERIAERIRSNEPLHDLFEMVRFWDGAAIRRIVDIAFGYLQGSRTNDGETKESEQGHA